MNTPITFAICGCGVRGLDVYAAYQKSHPEKMAVTAGADPRPERLRLLEEEYGVPKHLCFSNSEELLRQPKLADVMIIATQDRQHVGEALKALDQGYHLLLEKPISPDIAECLALQKKAHETGRLVIVCHVLRYTKFYNTLYRLLRSGAIGKIQTAAAAEHVGYWHYCHSFVRGNWRDSHMTSPMVLAKCCHDMDILRWLIQEPCVRLSSFGSLSHFSARNAPDGSAPRCMDGCQCKADCPFDAEKIYLDNPKTGFKHTGSVWPCTVLDSFPSEERILEAIKKGPYGRCVYHCDNNVVDHQTINMEFEQDITAVFTVSAFSQDCHRTIRIMGSLGEVEGDMEENRLAIRRFGQETEVLDLENREGGTDGHGGGDEGIMESICGLMDPGGEQGLTSIDVSIESHLMALAAEASRTGHGRLIELKEFARQF